MSGADIWNRRWQTVTWRQDHIEIDDFRTGTSDTPFITAANGMASPLLPTEGQFTSQQHFHAKHPFLLPLTTGFQHFVKIPGDRMKWYRSEKRKRRSSSDVLSRIAWGTLSDIFQMTHCNFEMPPDHCDDIAKRVHFFRRYCRRFVQLGCG